MVLKKSKKWLFFVMSAVIAITCCISVFAQPGGISAQAYILFDATDETVLAGKNENEQLPMASTTKIMTTLIALEQPKLDEPIIAEESALKVEGTSMGLLPNDTVTLRDLCYGMMLASGNDAANLAAITIAGSVEAFAEQMNKRAEQIGMKNTNFVTPSGLHNEEHYSTAYDMAKLAQEALKNEEFRTICSSKKVKLEYGNPPYTRWLSNHNKMLDYYEGCIGLKTGFTKAAGRCLVSAAERNGKTLICVTLKAPNDWQDHTALFDYGFAVLSEAEKTDPNRLPNDLMGLTATVVGSEKTEVTLFARGDSGLSDDQRNTFEKRVLLRSFYYAPLKEAQSLGVIEYLKDGEVVAREDLLTKQAVLRDHEVSSFHWFQKG